MPPHRPSARTSTSRELIEDDELRENLRNAFVSAKKAYGRVNGKGPAKVLDDKKVQRELKDAATSLKDAADSLRGQKKRKSRKGRILLLGIVGAGIALVASGGSEGPRRAVRRRGGVRVHGHDAGRAGVVNEPSAPRSERHRSGVEAPSGAPRRSGWPAS